eukprot:jgi/Mesvir1/332/Mv22739-RA.1
MPEEGVGEGGVGLDDESPLSFVRAKSITPEFVDGLRLLIFKASKTALVGQKKYEWLQKFVAAMSTNHRELDQALEQCAQSNTVSLYPHESASFRRCLSALMHDVFPDEPASVSRPRVLYGLLRPLATAMSGLRCAPATSTPPAGLPCIKRKGEESADELTNAVAPSGLWVASETKEDHSTQSEEDHSKSTPGGGATADLSTLQVPRPEPSELVSLRSLVDDASGLVTPPSSTMSGSNVSGVSCAAPTKPFPKDRAAKGGGERAVKGGGAGRIRARWSPDPMGSRARKQVSPLASPTSCARSLSFESPNAGKSTGRSFDEEPPSGCKGSKDKGKEGARRMTNDLGQLDSPQGLTPLRTLKGRDSPECGMSPLIHLLQRQSSIGVGSSPFKHRDIIVPSAFGRTVRGDNHPATATPWRRYTSVSDGSFSGMSTITTLTSGTGMTATPSLDTPSLATVTASPRRRESFSSFDYSLPSPPHVFHPSPRVNKALDFSDNALALVEVGERTQVDDSVTVAESPVDLLHAQGRAKLKMLEEHIELAARAQAEAEGRRQHLDEWEKRLLERQMGLTAQEKGLTVRERELQLKEQELVAAEENQMRLAQRLLDDKTAALAMERSALTLRAKGLDDREVEMRRLLADVTARELRLSATTHNISKW